MTLRMVAITNNLLTIVVAIDLDPQFKMGNSGFVVKQGIAAQLNCGHVVRCSDFKVGTADCSGESGKLLLRSKVQVERVHRGFVFCSKLASKSKNERGNDCRSRLLTRQ